MSKMCKSIETKRRLMVALGGEKCVCVYVCVMEESGVTANVFGVSF